jgi:hypothetical protein
MAITRKRVKSRKSCKYGRRTVCRRKPGSKKRVSRKKKRVSGKRVSRKKKSRKSGKKRVSRKRKSRKKRVSRKKKSRKKRKSKYRGEETWGSRQLHAIHELENIKGPGWRPSVRAIVPGLGARASQGLELGARGVKGLFKGKKKK